jgi:hypothetical protein
MKNTDIYTENKSLKVENIKLKSVIEKLLIDKKLLQDQLTLTNVIHWIPIESNKKPNLEKTYFLVKYESGRIEQTWIDSDYRFFDMNIEEDVTNYVKYWASMPDCE